MQLGFDFASAEGGTDGHVLLRKQLWVQYQPLDGEAFKLVKAALAVIDDRDPVDDDGGRLPSVIQLLRSVSDLSHAQDTQIIEAEAALRCALASRPSRPQASITAEEQRKTAAVEAAAISEAERVKAEAAAEVERQRATSLGAELAQLRAAAAAAAAASSADPEPESQPVVPVPEPEPELTPAEPQVLSGSVIDLTAPPLPLEIEHKNCSDGSPWALQMLSAEQMENLETWLERGETDEDEDEAGGTIPKAARLDYKRQIIVFLQQHASDGFLKAHRLRGKVPALRNSRNKKELLQAYRDWKASSIPDAVKKPKKQLSKKQLPDAGKDPSKKRPHLGPLPPRAPPGVPPPQPQPSPEEMTVKPTAAAVVVEPSAPTTEPSTPTRPQLDLPPASPSTERKLQARHQPHDPPPACPVPACRESLQITHRAPLVRRPTCRRGFSKRSRTRSSLWPTRRPFG